MLGAPAPMPPTQHYYAPAPLNPTDMYYSMPQPYNAMMNEGIVYETTPAAEASSNQSAEVSAVCKILRVSITFGACFHCCFGRDPQYER